MGGLILRMNAIGPKDHGRVEPRSTLLQGGREQQDVFDARVIAVVAESFENLHLLLQQGPLLVSVWQRWQRRGSAACTTRQPMPAALQLQGRGKAPHRCELLRKASARPLRKETCRISNVRGDSLGPQRRSGITWSICWRW